MKILHTADWHIVQLFHKDDGTYEHQQFLNWLLETLIRVHEDVLLTQRAFVFFPKFTKDEKLTPREAFTVTRIYFRISRQIFAHYCEQKRVAENFHLLPPSGRVIRCKSSLRCRLSEAIPQAAIN